MTNGQAIAESAIHDKILWKKSIGPVAYPDALLCMSERAADIREKSAGEMVWLLEHPPLFTAGTSAKAADLFNPHGFPTYAAGRGGQWTYHGPGQRIAYVMLDLQKSHGPLPPRDLRAFVAALERWIIDALASLGIECGIRCGRIGVWTTDPLTGQEAKIAALGIRVSRWVSWHGVAINVDPDLADFDGIVPCGIRDFGVTSLRRFHPGLTIEALDRALVASWPKQFGAVPQWEEVSSKTPAESVLSEVRS